MGRAVARTMRVRGHLNDDAIEVAFVGAQSVWITYLGPQGGRRATLALDASECRELARLLVFAADAVEASR